MEKLESVSDSTSQLAPAIDIYSFGMCALEMAALEIQGNGDSGTMVTEEHIRRTVDSLDEGQQKDFIRKCLEADPLKRPSARELLFHPVLFEVHSLKLLAAHALVNSTSKSFFLVVHSISFIQEISTLLFIIKLSFIFSKYIRNYYGRGTAKAIRSGYRPCRSQVPRTTSSTVSFERYTCCGKIRKVCRGCKVSSKSEKF